MTLVPHVSLTNSVQRMLSDGKDYLKPTEEKSSRLFVVAVEDKVCIKAVFNIASLDLANANVIVSP